MILRMILSRLGNTVTNNDRKKIKSELHETEKKKNLSDEEKEEIYDNLAELIKKKKISSIKKKNINIMTLMIWITTE